MVVGAVLLGCGPLVELGRSQWARQLRDGLKTSVHLCCTRLRGNADAHRDARAARWVGRIIALPAQFVLTAIMPIRSFATGGASLLWRVQSLGGGHSMIWNMPTTHAWRLGGVGAKLGPPHDATRPFPGCSRLVMHSRAIEGGITERMLQLLRSFLVRGTGRSQTCLVSLRLTSPRTEAWRRRATPEGLEAWYRLQRRAMGRVVMQVAVNLVLSARAFVDLRRV